MPCWRCPDDVDEDKSEDDDDELDWEPVVYKDKIEEDDKIEDDVMLNSMPRCCYKRQYGYEDGIKVELFQKMMRPRCMS